jgi:hypothetical protein
MTSSLPVFSQIQYPTDEEIQGIKNVCAMGDVKGVETKLDAALKEWRKLSGSIEISAVKKNLGAMLDKITSTSDGAAIYREYVGCVQNLIEKYIQRENVENIQNSTNRAENKKADFIGYTYERSTPLKKIDEVLGSPTSVVNSEEKHNGSILELIWYETDNFRFFVIEDDKKYRLAVGIIGQKVGVPHISFGEEVDGKDVTYKDIASFTPVVVSKMCDDITISEPQARSQLTNTSPCMFGNSNRDPSYRFIYDYASINADNCGMEYWASHPLRVFSKCKPYANIAPTGVLVEYTPLDNDVVENIIAYPWFKYF